MLSSAVTDLAGILSTSLADGNGSARASFGGKSQAFGWASGRVNTAVAYLATGVSKSRSFNALTITETAEVSPYTTGDKPVTATIAGSTVNLAMYPGVVEVKTADILDAAGLGQALQVALFSQAMKALDKAVVTAMLAQTVNTVPKAAALGTIAEGQALLLEDGFNPDLLVVSASLYGTLAGTAGVVQAGFDPTQAVQSVLGSRCVISSALTGAQAVVLDSNAVMAVEHESSPVALVEVKARANTVDVVIELVAGHVVTAAGGVCPIKATT